jgi:hypothetical protein
LTNFGVFFIKAPESPSPCFLGQAPEKGWFFIELVSRIWAGKAIAVSKIQKGEKRK